MMLPHSDSVFDEYDRPVPGATVYVYNIDGSEAALTVDGAVALSQPIVTDQLGTYSYFADTGYYREDVWFAGKLRHRRSSIAIGNPGADLALRSDVAAATGAGLLGFIDNGVGAAATTVRDFLRQITHKASGQFFANLGAKVQRLRDKVLMGDAADALGTSAAAQGDWLTTFLIGSGRTQGFMQFAQAGVLTQDNPNAANAIVVGARSGPLGSLGNIIAVLGVGVNDDTTDITQAYGGYFEAYRVLGSVGGTYGFEVDTVNFASPVTIDPFTQLATQTVGVQIASGADYSTGLFSSSAAINIRHNGSNFLSGIQFGSDAIQMTSGVGEAIAFSVGHKMQWYGAAGVKTSAIFSDGTTAAGGSNLQFGEGFVRLNNSAGKGLARFVNVTNAVNFVTLTNAVTGSPAKIAPDGDDVNSDLLLTGKGTGSVALAPLASATPLVNGQMVFELTSNTQLKIKVKGSDGTVRSTTLTLA